MRVLIMLMPLMLIASISIGQNRLSVYKVEGSSGFSGVSSHIVNLYANDDRFIVIDKANSQIIEDEQDRQKNEEFIDGYIVEQGIQEGFDYCYYPKYIKADETILIKLYDVAKGTVIASRSIEAKLNFIGLPKAINASVDEAIADINQEVFQVRLEVVRMIEDKKNKAKALLVAIGHNQNAKKDREYEVYIVVEENVGGRSLTRNKVVGRGEIKEVEDANFSQLKVTKGGSQIYQLLSQNQTLYIQHLNK